MSGNFFFHYQIEGGEEAWKLEISERRAQVVQSSRPAFTTVLDLSSVPDDNDWSRVRYQGPFYADFDADGDLELACMQFKLFLSNLQEDFGLDLDQVKLYASGGKGFHCEVPAECFRAKLPNTGTVWLPYIYEHMARELVVDTMDMRVYSGKRGRMWRTPGVRRSSGAYKVPLTADEAMAIDEDMYAILVAEPRPEIVLSPPTTNSKLMMLFERAKDKASAHMRGRKKRQEKSSRLLDPWKKSGKTPSAIEALMSGDGVAEGAGFQSLSMQLAIYATSVGIALNEFLSRCAGLCEKHVSDSRRYNTPGKRKDELARMWRYMDESALYDFDVGPLVVLVAPGVSIADLGVIEKEDAEDRPAPKPQTDDEAEATAETVEPQGNNSIRKGFFVNADGMWKTEGDNTNLICRATVRNVEAFYDIEKNEFKGYEFDIVQAGKKVARPMVSSEGLTSAAPLKKFFAAYQIAFQGGDFEAMALLDVMAEKARRNGRVYVYPREGFAVINHPTSLKKEPIKIYLTQDHFLSSQDDDAPEPFRLKYRPAHAMSAYNIDIHKAPDLDDSMIPMLHDLFSFNKPSVVADTLGWFVACHYHSAYLYLFNKFPLLQIYGEAGAGKSQTVLMLSRLHWYLTPYDIKSAASFTPFTLDVHASTSESAPLIVDEFKPRELRKKHGAYEKLKDVFKAAYMGASIGERGTVNKGAESTLAIVKSRATAPIVFMGEAVEMETAIIERSISVNFTKANHMGYPERTAAFDRLQGDTTAISALGKAIAFLGFKINLETMKAEVWAIQKEIEAAMPDINDPNRRRAAPRAIFNQAVIIHALRTLKKILAMHFGNEFDAKFDMLAGVRSPELAGEEDKLLHVHAMSEVSKVLARAALLSRARDQPWELITEKDYLVGDGYMELRVDRIYDQYRRYCSSIGDVPLFDNLDAFIHALGAYNPCTDQLCVASELRAQDESGRIVRLDLRKLAKEGVQSFKY